MNDETTAQQTPAAPRAPGEPPTSAAPQPLKPSFSDWPAALAGYAGGVLAVLGGAIFWPLIAIAVGALAPRARVAGALGLALGGLVMAALNSSRGPVPAYEGPDFGVLFGPPFALLSIGVGVPLGSLLIPRTGSPQPAVKRPSPSDLAVLIGVLAVAATGLTGSLQLAVPSRASFAIDLPGGWSGPVRTPSDAWFDPSYGNHFTAVFGSTEPPPNTGLPRVPVVGVSVIRADYSPQACIRDVHGWSSNDFPLYRGTILSERDVALPAGAAHRIARVLTARSSDGPSLDPPTADAQAGRLYAWGLARERQVGMLRENLCYMLTVTLPAGSELGEADADAIAASFRFR